MFVKYLRSASVIFTMLLALSAVLYGRDEKTVGINSQMRWEEYQKFLADYKQIDAKDKETVEGQTHLFIKAQRKSDGKIVVIVAKYRAGGTVTVELKDVAEYRHWWP
jgi:hypothetical protein